MSLETDLDALEAMDLAGLRRVWRPAYGPRPTLRSVDILRRLIAWQVQVDGYGALDRPTKDALRRTTTVGTRGKPSIGSRLSREWKGIRHEVEVIEDGYRYDGATYRSLSTVATHIAGTKWNGWRFFGLGEAPAAGARKAA